MPPQIQEYLPEVEAQGPVGGVSPNVELAGAAGRGLEQLGSAIGESADLIHRRNAQAETADVYSAFAEKRAQYTDQIQQQVNDGSLNVEKFKEQYDQDTQNIADKIDTPEGKNFFNRQQARLKGHLLQMASRGQAMVAQKQTVGAWQDGVTANSNAVEKDPNSFADTYHAGLEAIDELIKNQGLPESMRDHAVKAMGVEYSKAAIRGYAQNGDTGPAQARHMMTEGAFDDFLDSDHKRQMSMEIDHYERANEAEDARQVRAQEKAQQLGSEKWVSDRFEKLESGALSTRDISNAVRTGQLKWETGERLINIVDKASRDDLRSDPVVKQDLIQRIADPNSTNPISSLEEILPHVGKGISITDFKQMSSLIDMTPEGSALKMGTKTLFDSAKSIRFKDDLAGGYSDLGNKKFAQFQMDFIAEKNKIKKAGGNVGDLVNPESPLYFGNRIPNYQTPLGERYQQNTNNQVKQALGVTPTANNPNPTPLKEAAKPGEDPDAYLVRINSKRHVDSAPIAPPAIPPAAPGEPLPSPMTARDQAWAERRRKNREWKPPK